MGNPIYDEAPVFDFVRQARRRARKAYTCSFCGQPIVAGEEYWNTFSVVEGKPHTDHAHTKDGYCSWGVDDGSE